MISDLTSRCPCTLLLRYQPECRARYCYGCRTTQVITSAPLGEMFQRRELPHAGATFCKQDKEYVHSHMNAVNGIFYAHDDLNNGRPAHVPDSMHLVLGSATQVTKQTAGEPMIVSRKSLCDLPDNGRCEGAATREAFTLSSKVQT